MSSSSLRAAISSSVTILEAYDGPYLPHRSPRVLSSLTLILIFSTFSESVILEEFQQAMDLLILPFQFLVLQNPRSGDRRSTPHPRTPATSLELNQVLSKLYASPTSDTMQTVHASLASVTMQTMHTSLTSIDG